MKRIVFALALAVMLMASSSAMATTVSYGRAYMPPFTLCYFHADSWERIKVFVANITDGTVHIKITIYTDAGVVQNVYESDVAPRAAYQAAYMPTDHPNQYDVLFYGIIEWTADFSTDKAVIAHATSDTLAQNLPSWRSHGIYSVPINNGLPF